MSWILLALICILLVGSAYRCFRRVRLEEVRQDIYRIREGIYDRVIAGELSLEDPNVSSLVHYLHGFIWFLDHWSPLLCVLGVAIGRARQERVVVPWMDDRRLKKEAWLTLQTTVQALRRAWLPLRFRFPYPELSASWMEKTPRELIEQARNQQARVAARERACQAYEATTRMVSGVKKQGAVSAITA